MSDDSFIREVNEEIRQEQAKAIWDRYGAFALALAALVIVVTAGYVAYDYWDASRANASGDKFSQALLLAEQGKSEEARAALNELEENGYGAYPVLARMRAATLLAEQGDSAGAVREFDAVAADGSIPASLRDMAKLRAAFVLVDDGSYQDVVSRAEPLAADTNPVRHSAREVLALSAWKEGRAADALKLYDQILADQEAPRNIRDRATVMAELIRGSGAAS